ncbi:hypothetical protein MMC11_004077 [Xylographa trunciseda]|nr:hypothetical protein [Xylographa trunciseda]
MNGRQTSSTNPFSDWDSPDNIDNMSTQIAANVLAGALFGAALTASAVYVPAVITSQMYLQDFHMLTVFLVASASSAFVVWALNTSGRTSFGPRSPSTISLFSTYDANIIGGLLLGAGMTISGACPGTVLSQVATGIPSGFFTLIGAIFGGILWTGYGFRLKSQPSSAPAKAASSRPPTIQSYFKLSTTQALVTYEGICLVIVLLITTLNPRTSIPPTVPVIGGLLIGATQASSLHLTANPLGTSSAFEEVGHWFWYAWHSLTGSDQVKSTPGKPSTRSMTFVFGVVVGSWVFAQLSTEHLSAASTLDERSSISALSAFVGGCIMIFGSRLAGGCTSGHGISGIATMGVASFVSVASMFAGGIGLAACLG